MTMNATQPKAVPELASHFRFDRILLAKPPLPERVVGCLRQSIDFFDGHTALSAIRKLARQMNLASIQQEQLFATIVSIGHIGFLLPAETGGAMLQKIVGAAGLAISASMPSKIFAKELGMLTGWQHVETQIYRMEGVSKKGKPVCIEVFVPREEPALVNGWIANGFGTHVAFLAKSPDSVMAIQNILEDCRNFVPPFMRGQPMEGREKGSRILYYDLPADLQCRKLRVEFYYGD